jgi:hypothetical protein
MDKSKVGLLEYYEGLWIPEDMRTTLIAFPQVVVNACNGTGSTESFLGRVSYPFLPESFFGMDILPAVSCHDWMGTYPSSFDTEKQALEYFHKGNRVFRNNLFRLCEKGCSSWMGRRLYRLRMFASNTAFEAVERYGTASFWVGKTIVEKEGCIQNFSIKND